ncbi:GAF and ANTAR domain-containing protein [Amycolatopsis pithecellobii]|uniref:ANTAR domain-containing protein n=1 Tax=Amycolatopsis pithecellobii TaxID=664692 RepID=A0A6N7Z946_9PSEU|nr:GAF and ANTAR domain-containing protein [Amycolatopsis pithecellobii]MTD58026.1 ANTAR domain-containing protein [Amycolatopsis pithecellobii]
MHREVEIAAAFIALTDLNDRLSDEARYADCLAGYASRLLNCDAAGVLLAGPDGRLGAATTSPGLMEIIQLAELRVNDGPSVSAFHTGAATSVADLRTDERWKPFRSVTLQTGFTGVHAIPVPSPGKPVGAITLLRRRPGPFSYEDDRLAESLAAIAGAHLCAKRAITSAETRSEQLKTTLRSRIGIEQAKGILAERHGITLTAAFERMRSFARHHRRRLDDVARTIVENSPSAAQLDPLTRPTPG